MSNENSTNSEKYFILLLKRCIKGDSYMKTGEIIRKLRKDSKMTQKDFAAKL